MLSILYPFCGFPLVAVHLVFIVKCYLLAFAMISEVSLRLALTKRGVGKNNSPPS